MATLFVVSTPIGNLEDLTGRAARVLGEVERILAEDTRRTRVLLTHLGIRGTLVSLHAHNEAERLSQVLSWLDSGEDLALVSDAGTPLVSDPGQRLVAGVIDAGHRVSPLPGPSAALAALVVSGLPADRFVFLGFPPRSGAERAGFLDRVADSEETALLFESPERVGRLLRDLAKVAGSRRLVCVARELTKLHETVFRGTLGEAAGYYDDQPPRGEVVVVVAPGERRSRPEADREAAVALARSQLEEGTRPSQVAKDVARRLGIPRNRAYQIIQELRGGGEEG
jgi:16S rRNA (cytidine1402-2'-O)-methyltransferase